MPADYFYSKQRMNFWQQSPSLLGSERTGPDLSSVGERQPGRDWHLLHLYNPRLVVKESVMPAYPWMFTEKSYPDEDDVVLNVPEKYRKDPSKNVVASEKVLRLIDYLLSLKQTPVQNAGTFIPSKREKKEIAGGEQKSLFDGEQLYITNCSACHQKTGEGLPGAFPPLKNSKIVTNEDPGTLIRIVLQGYDARQEYGVMPSFSERLSDEEIAAIATHERSSWGNKAGKVDPQQVKKIRELIKSEIVQ
jgi:cytochrome c oxidase cbb3-type subunit 2